MPPPPPPERGPVRFAAAKPVVAGRGRGSGSGDQLGNAAAFGLSQSAVAPRSSPLASLTPLVP
eukprot:8115614-Lingulodinium_polyedra.AAC.1